MEFEGVVVRDANEGSRKKHKKLSKRQLAKKLRYRDHFPNLENFERPCNHNGKTYKCLEISDNDIILWRNKVYSKPEKAAQDRKLSYFLNVQHPKRHREKYKQVCRRQKHVLSTKYCMLTQNGKKYRVCQKMFLAAFGLSQKRVHTITRRLIEGKDIQENRGGDRRAAKYEEKRQSVKNFISSLKAKESHYSRNKSKRLYLPASLNIKRLMRLYNESAKENLRVNYSFFFKIFSNDFNIGFGTPSSDVCSFCFRSKRDISNCKEEQLKVQLMTEYRIHRIRAKQFHLLMKEKDDRNVIFCFDLQQVQNLPKLPLGEAFYLRQLAFYCFCITDTSTKNPSLYTWNEMQARRGANEVASALTNFLNNYDFPTTCEAIQLFADGCGGQNKNSYVIYALALWLLNNSPVKIKNIVLTFPVRGHSFMPADRVFGRLEKLLRKNEVILNYEAYLELYAQVGTVKRLGQEWTLKNFKALSSDLKKMTGIKEMKRIILQKTKTKVRGVEQSTVKVKMEQFYRNNDPSKQFAAITKKGKNIINCSVHHVELKNKIKLEKMNDLKKLLSLFDKNWEEIEDLKSYKDLFLLSSVEDGNHNEEEEDSENECNCCEEDSTAAVV